MAAKKRSLGLVTLLLLLCLSVAPVGVTATYLVAHTQRELENTASQTVSFYTGQFSSRAEAILKSLGGSIFIITTDAEILAAMRDETRASLAGAEENAARVLANTGGAQSSVTGIFVFKDEERYLPILRGGIYSGSTSRAVAAYRAFRDENSARRLQYTGALPGFCYLIANYLDLNSMEVLGKIVIEIDTELFLDSQYLRQVYSGAQLMLSDLDGKMLYGDAASPLAAAKGGVLPFEDFTRVGGERYYHVGSRLGHYNLRLDVFLPEREIFATINSTVRLYIVVTLVVLLCTLALSLAVFALVTRPLRHLAEAIGKVAGGKLDVQLPATPYRETEQITTAFNSMTERLQELFGEVYESGLYLRDAEFKSLEAQINPHFIFNVLEVINMRAMAAGQADICRMVERLSGLLRGNLAHRNQQKIRFGQELEYVDFYLKLQKERFEENLHYSIQLEDEEIRSLYLPRLTLQPLVENSVVHGLETKRGGGGVSLRIWEEEDSVYARVTDDGAGFDPALVPLELPPPQGGPHNHLALYNIHRRIQLLYGGAYGLRIESSPGQGSSVTIVLPVDKGPDEPEGEGGAAC